MNTERGVTLLELVVALALVALAASVAGVAIQRPRTAPSSALATEIAAARRRALASGRTVVVKGASPAGPWSVTARPDGVVLADTAGATR